MKKILILLASILTVFSCSKTGNDPSDPKKDPEEKKVFSVETSSLFEKHTDPTSGVVSYILKANTLNRENSQGSYFTNKSMTNDGRFIFFFTSYNEWKHSNTDRFGAIIDLKTDKIYTIPKASYANPYLDVENDKIYYAYKFKTKNAKFYMRDLLKDPANDIELCDYPEAIYAGGEIKRLYTHLSLTSDRKKAFVDARVNDHFVLGMVDLTNGNFELWERADTNLCHAQICPTNDNLVLCAIDSFTDANGVEHPIVNHGKVYPRLQLMEKKGDKVERRTIPSQVTNYATHENFHEKGTGFYFCTKGVRYHDIESGEETRLCDRGVHAYVGYRKTFLTCDVQHYGTYRGCPWAVYFYNISSEKGVYIHTKTGAVGTEKNPSNLHPDPHPHLVCNDKYIICTMSDNDGNMRLSVTPVEQLLEMTE